MKILLMYQPSHEHLDALQTVAPGAAFEVAPTADEAQRMITDADAVLGNRFFLQSLPYAQRLRWMQSNSMGTDMILRSGILPPELIITSARGVYDDEVADHAVALVLALARGIPCARDDQHRHAWNRRPLITLSDKRALVLGWGGVGRAIARRLAAFGMVVEGARRHHTGLPASYSEGFKVNGPMSWRKVLSVTDVLVTALPLTAETEHLIGERELACLPPGAFVVNVGRGGTLCEQALITALTSGRLAGAALDVFEDEPLPATNPLWDTPGLLVTPHVGRSPEDPPFRWETLFVENLRRFVAGERLLNVADRSVGY